MITKLRLDEGQVHGVKEWKTVTTVILRLWVRWGLCFLSGRQMALLPQHQFFLTNTQDWFSGKYYLGSNKHIWINLYYIFCVLKNLYILKISNLYKRRDEYNDSSWAYYPALRFSTFDTCFISLSTATFWNNTLKIF